jgi:AcrR family transcriptional regulator
MLIENCYRQFMSVSTKERVLRAAAELLADGGRDAVSTRAVSAAAGIQAPTLYRLFGDKDGLLDAVAAHGFTEYLGRKKQLAATDDPVADLRAGWDLHVEFGLSRPAFYVLMFGETGRVTEASHQAAERLNHMVTRVADAGRLRMSVARAVQLTHATCVGVTMALIAADEPDLEISAIARESMMCTITTDEPENSDATVASRAMALRTALPPADRTPLSPAEHALLTEWLDRLADAR